MPRLFWCLLALLNLSHIALRTKAASLSCIELTRLNASAPEGVQACCSEEWYTSYSAINGSVPAGTKRLYCGSPSNRDVDYRLARSNTSWYEYCLESSCPLEDVEICCVTDTPASNTTTIFTTPSDPDPSPEPSPSPSPSPGSRAAGNDLWRQRGAIWAVYVCPHAAPSTALFGHELAPPTNPPATATATAKAAALNLTTAPASKLLAACPSVREGTAPPAYETTFNFSAYNPHGTENLGGIEIGKPYLLSFFRKPSLGAVNITLSVRVLVDEGGSGELLYDHISITLDAPSPSVVAAVPSWTGKGTARRKLQSSFSSGWAPGAIEADEDFDRWRDAAVHAQGAHRTLHRAGGGGSGHGGGGGGSRGRSRSRSKYSSSNYKYEGYNITGRVVYSNETLTTSELYRGEAFPGVQFVQNYTYREPKLSAPNRTMAFAVPALYRYSYVVNSSVVNTTYGFYGPSVFLPNGTFQYVSNTRWPAPKGAPECTSCADRTSCCSGGLSCCQGSPGDFENNNWRYDEMQPNRRATLLSCGLIQDFITTLPIYFPIAAADLRITIHSVEATATTAAPACGDTAATLDPREPPLYLTVLQADEADITSASSSRQSSRKSAACTSSPATLLALVLIVLVLLLAA